MKTVYICRDNVTGIFSAVYDAWKENQSEETCGIAFADCVEQQLFCEYKEVTEEERKAVAVEKMVYKNLGRDAYWDIYHAALSNDMRKGDAILGTMLAAKKIPDSRRIMEHLSHPKVEKVFELGRNVMGEAHALKGFLRFRELNNGVLFAQIEPKNQVLTCLAPHFCDRLPVENWMIFDKRHQMFAIHEAKKQWVLVQGEQLNVEMAQDVSENELEYARLWKSFCKSISIESRESGIRQRQHLPLRFRPNMVEFAENSTF